MKPFAMLLIAASLMLPAFAAPDAEVAPVAVVAGGHWEAGAVKGTYRVVAESIGFEHVSCRVWIEWVTVPGSGPSNVAARVPFTELSNGFWACDPGGNAISLADDRLTLRTTHTYSGETRTFEVILGAPGEYRMVGQ